MGFLQELLDGYWNQKDDPRTADWFLVSPPWLIYGILAVYLYLVKIAGPKYMERKEPWTLKTFMFYYNIFQIISNAWFVYQSLKLGMFTTITVGCELLDPSPTGAPLEIAKFMYYAYLMKILDLAETVVFVLRKKNRQISFLHVYHHVTTVCLAYVTVKQYPCGAAMFAYFLNCCIHVVMYTYYLLSSQGPSMQKALNVIKPYITIMQMVQFGALLVHLIQGLMPSCAAPKWWVFLLLVNLLMNFVLFFNFYLQNYKPPKVKQK